LRLRNRNRKTRRPFKRSEPRQTTKQPLLKGPESTRRPLSSLLLLGSSHRGRHLRLLCQWAYTSVAVRERVTSGLRSYQVVSLATLRLHFIQHRFEYLSRALALALPVLRSAYTATSANICGNSTGTSVRAAAWAGLRVCEDQFSGSASDCAAAWSFTSYRENPVASGLQWEAASTGRFLQLASCRHLLTFAKDPLGTVRAPRERALQSLRQLVNSRRRFEESTINMAWSLRFRHRRIRRQCDRAPSRRSRLAGWYSVPSMLLAKQTQSAKSVRALMLRALLRAPPPRCGVQPSAAASRGAPRSRASIMATSTSSRCRPLPSNRRRRCRRV
jgi:hypothetical protein